MEIPLATWTRRATLEQQLLNGNIKLHDNCLSLHPNEVNAIFSHPASKGNRPMVALSPISPRGATKVDRAWQNRTESMANHIAQMAPVTFA
jgi:hypothetical protein